MDDAELVRKLREKLCYILYQHQHERVLAADRIEALIAERDAALEEAAVSHVVKVAKDDAGGVSFPPEADGDFDIVNKADIAKLRAEMEEKFGISQSRLTVIDDPKISSECPVHVDIAALPAH